MRAHERYILLAVLALFAWMGEPVGPLVRAFSIPVLVVLFAMHVAASLSLKALLGLFRLLLALPLGALSAGYYLPHGQLYYSFVFAVLALTIGLGPYLPIKKRQLLYGAVMLFGPVGSWLDSNGDLLSRSAIGAAQWLILAVVFAIWRKNGSSPIDREVLDFKRQSRKQIDWLNGRSDRHFVLPWRTNRFEKELQSFLELRPHPDSRALLREICGKCEESALATMLSYAFAIAENDFGRAAIIIKKAHSRGLDYQVGYLPLAYALRAVGDPGWTDARAIAYTRGELARNQVDELRDPFLFWRSDPTFGRIESYVMPSSQFLPPRVRA